MLSYRLHKINVFVRKIFNKWGILSATCAYNYMVSAYINLSVNIITLFIKTLSTVDDSLTFVLVKE